MILTLVFGFFTLIATSCRKYGLKAKGMSVVWLMVSLVYLSYLHGAWYSPSLFQVENNLLFNYGALVPYSLLVLAAASYTSCL